MIGRAPCAFTQALRLQEQHLSMIIMMVRLISKSGFDYLMII
jgi:hypothetical protein